MASDKVAVNSRNSRPTMPPINRMGMNTATSDTLIEMTVKPTSLAPRSAASCLGIPFSTCREMFSSTTMASSTTNPVAIVSAIRDRLSRLKPRRYMPLNVPIRDTGTTTAGTSAARTSPSARNTTKVTSATASISVHFVSRREARMVALRSDTMVRFTSLGSEACSCGSSAFT